MERSPTQLVMAVMIAVVLIGLPGCNTIEGAGKDLEAAGEAVQDAARDD